LSSAPLPALLRLLALDRLPRSGWIQAGVPESESVGAHVLGSAFVALALAPRVAPALDVDRAVSLALVHDAPEALLGDVPKDGARHLPRGAKRAAEDGAASELLGPLSDAALERFREFRSGETREARFAALCDKLQLGVRLVAYHRAGARGLGSFRATLAALDCAEFPPCDELKRALLAALDAPPPEV
jgi:putative hydrolase of HD superfamily